MHIPDEKSLPIAAAATMHKALQCVKLIHRLSKRIWGRYSVSLKSWCRQTQGPALSDIMWLSAWGCRLCFLAWGVAYRGGRDSGLVLVPCTAPSVCVRAEWGASLCGTVLVSTKTCTWSYFVPYCHILGRSCRVNSENWSQTSEGAHDKQSKRGQTNPKY